MLEYCLRPEPAVCRIAAARRKQLSRAEADALSLFPVSSWSASEAFWSIHLHFVGASDQQLYSLHRHDGKCAIWTSMSPEDCCSARTRREHLQALQHIQTMVSGKIVPSQKINLASLKRGPASRTPKFNHHRYLTLRVVKLIGMSRICIRMA